ncbi:multidrug transporter [Shewanella sp. Actino-trap-3]|uniref:SapC family protein n=1 Tax=Shewanella sp. Actino-trap-3 TaxID=2058331 RepID=UPI000C3244DF|nr:SapC family protein [Shewanella sp. Actino-trap-3]PKG78131.1 multidrug transporter [Shewanella sp. Actino-trap-3]
MSNHQMLNNEQHKNLKVYTKRSSDLGDNVMITLTFPSEFYAIQSYYPIVFYKTESTEEFQAFALLGLEKKENLFLSSDERWDCGYVPHTIKAQPFLIGYQNQEINGQIQKQKVIHLDVDSPRLNEHEGESIFTQYGQNTPFIEHIGDILGEIDQGFEDSKQFFHLLNQFNLLEKFVFDIKLNDQSNNRLSGFYTVNEDILSSLSSQQLFELNQKGFLKPLYMASASMLNMSELIKRKNQRLQIK